METIKINLFDANLTKKNRYLNDSWPEPLIEYIRPPLLEFDGISLFTDEMCFHPEVENIKSKYKVAFAFESPFIKPYITEHIHKVEHKFDYICCYNPKPGNPKYIQSYSSACWVPERFCGLHKKNKLLSISASDKNYAPGHKIRHKLISMNLHKDLELWGTGYNRFGEEPIDRYKPYKDYMYAIVVENCKYPNYFTEKIIDCFACGCIPIYWGDPNIKERFNENGFYVWNDFNELKNILEKISEEDYRSKAESIAENHKKFRDFASPDKLLYKISSEIQMK
jgi:hypothetical protein